MNKTIHQNETPWQLLCRLQTMAVRDGDKAGGYILYVDVEKKEAHVPEHPERDVSIGPLETGQLAGENAEE